MIGYTQGLSDLFRCYFKLQCRSNRWQANDKGIPIVFSPYTAACYAGTQGAAYDVVGEFEMGAESGV